MNNNSNYIKNKLKLLPHKPGSYQMKNKDNIIIYVGKAKDLNNRVKSYFTGKVTGKTKLLVSEITDFDYIVTKSELESLILEINLIKKYNPKYNILLKDDKTYPYIELTNDKYPMLKIVRNINRKKNKGHLFGPFPNVKAARDTVNLLGRIYPLRKCQTLKKDVCLYYHIGKCLGYCQKNIDQAIIDQMKEEVTSFLKGDKKNVVDKLKEEMYQASDNLNYEKANEIKSILESINITLEKQKIDLNRKTDLDVLGFYWKDNYIAVTIFFIRGGLLFGTHKETFTFINEEEITEYIINFYKNHLIPKEIIIDYKTYQEILTNYLNVKVTVPVKGELRNILDMAINNSKIKINEEEELLKRKEESRINALNNLRSLLHMPNLSTIEAFDNSHLFGTYYVGAMVHYEDFLPRKDLYRKYKIDITTKDDLTAMKEVIYRRYFRLMMENAKYPDLIIVDGGILQVNIAKEVIDSLKLNIKVIGLKKDNNHRTNYLVTPTEEISLKDQRDLYVYLSKIQEEVHRYAITYHRDIKSKGLLSSSLDLIKGIGPKKKKELLKKYGSISKMKEASIEDLSKVVGKLAAEELYNHLKNIS